MRRIFYLLLIFNLCWPVSILAQKGRVRHNWWPLFFFQESRDGSVRELQLFGPFYYSYETRFESGAAFRPLLAVVERKNTRDVFFLSPLGHYQKEPDSSRFRLIPLWARNSDAEENRRHHNFGLSFWGKSEKGEKYWGIFPFYGRLLDWNGKDEVRFYLWPIRVRSRFEGNVSSTWFWPIYNRTDGPTFYERKFWPFYSRKIKKDAFDRSFFLWPFFWHEEFYLAEGKTTRDMFLPFWVEERGPVHQRFIFLWPFFRLYREERQDITALDLPWPIFKYGEGKKTVYRERRFWPLLGYRKTEEEYSHFVLWPLYTYRFDVVRHRELEWRRETRTFLLFTRFERVRDKRGHLKYQFSRVWPLGEQIKRDDGFELFFFPAILPFHSEGVDRTIAPLLRLYEYLQDPNGFTRSKALWGFYRHDHTDEEDIVELAFLLSFHRKPEGWRFSFLKGLLGFGREEGHLKLQVLFIPLL